MPLDFDRITFFECIARAASERAYSAAFGWLFSEQSALSLDQRLKVLEKLIGKNTPNACSIDADTEWQSVDLLLIIKAESTNPLRIIAFENKIKASEGDGQLARYDVTLGSLQNVEKVFLTLNGEIPRSGSGWIPISYSTLLSALREHVVDDRYVHDLSSAMGRLVSISEATLSDDGPLVSTAFGDNDACSPMASYIKKMRLKAVVQRMWMSRLASTLSIESPWQCKIGVLNGQATLDVDAALQNREGYAIGLQLQNHSLKLFCSPDPYAEKVNEDVYQSVREILLNYRQNFGCDPNARMSNGKKRGFCSIPVADMPKNRQLNEWREKVQPYLLKLQKTFPQVIKRERPGSKTSIS